MLPAWTDDVGSCNVQFMDVIMFLGWWDQKRKKRKRSVEDQLRGSFVLNLKAVLLLWLRWIAWAQEDDLRMMIYLRKKERGNGEDVKLTNCPPGAVGWSDAEICAARKGVVKSVFMTFKDHPLFLLFVFNLSPASSPVNKLPNQPLTNLLHTSETTHSHTHNAIQEIKNKFKLCSEPQSCFGLVSTNSLRLALLIHHALPSSVTCIISKS